MTDTVLIPRAATLDGFLDSAAEAVNVHELQPMTSLVVRTRNTQYRIVVAPDSAIQVQGGRFFPGLTAARLEGSSAGGSLLKVGCITVGLRMEISVGSQRIVTSPVRTINRERLAPSPLTH